MGSPWRVLAVVLGAALAAQVSTLGALAPLALGTLLVLGNVVALRWRRWRMSPTVLDPAWFVAPLAAAWIVVILLPVHKFSHRGSETAPDFSVEALIEVLAFAGVAVVAMVIIRALEPTLARSRPPVLLFLVPVWTAASGMWGAAAPYAVVRGMQLLAVAVLAWATIALGRSQLAAFDAVLERVLRWFVYLTAVLLAAGIAFGPVYVGASEENRDRFTWAGAHPLAAGLILSVAVVILGATPPRVLRMPVWLRSALLVAFVGALVPNHSRQSWLALAVVILVGLGLAGRLAPMVRWIGGPLLGAAVVAGLTYRGTEIWDYILRNEDTDKLSTGNGRLGLWSVGFRALDTPFDWMFGLGHGITRTLFLGEGPWARSAHSSFLAALVSGGIIGLAVLVALLLGTARLIAITRVWERTPTGLTVSLLFVLVLLNGVASDNLAEPNLSFSALYLVFAVVLVRRVAEPVPDAEPVQSTGGPPTARAPTHGLPPALVGGR